MNPSIHPRFPRGRRTAGFTLVELLTVIAIIGVLAAIIIPTVGKVRESAQRTVDASNLREILKAALLYAADHNDRLPDPVALAADFPEVSPAFRIPAALARAGLLTDPSVYFARNDPHFNGTYPTAILDPASVGRNQLDSAFTTGRSLAWEFVGGVRLSDPPTTPIAFTRGLTGAGTWSPATGVYREAGGYVAYLGGHVVYHPSVAGRLISNASGRTVDDLRQAIPYNETNPARIYGTPPGSGSLLGSPTGTAATAGP
jgi:prepilin-type N-terminal cleavage/methylation domain-containing protein